MAARLTLRLGHLICCLVSFLRGGNEAVSSDGGGSGVVGYSLEDSVACVGIGGGGAGFSDEARGVGAEDCGVG